MKKKLTLKEAQKKGKIGQFIRQHKKDEPANEDRLKKVIASASSGKPKSSRGTSKKG